MFLGQEDHAHAIFAQRRQRDAARGHVGAVEVVGDLDQDAGAVTHQLVGADRTAVVEVLQDQQTLLDDAVRLAALDVGHEADAAGIVLAGGVVKAAAGRVLEFFRGRGGGPMHGTLLVGPQGAFGAGPGGGVVAWGRTGDDVER